MTIKIQEFLQNAYHFMTEVLETDSILKVSSKKGNVVILSETQYDAMMEMLEEKLKNKNKKNKSRNGK